MRIAVLANEHLDKGSWLQGEALAFSFSKQGHISKVLEGAQESFEKIDLAIIRVQDGSGGGTPAENYALELWKREVPFLISPPAREISRDKSKTHKVFQDKGILQPDWQVVCNAEEIDLAGPVVLKPLREGRSRNVCVFHSKYDIPALKEEVLVQSYIKPRFIWRVVASAEEVLWAYRKRPDPKTGIAGVPGGASRDYQSPDELLADISKRMALSLGAGVYGCDVIQDYQGDYLALEANSNFWFDLSSADRVAQFILRNV